MTKFLAILALWPFATIWRAYVITHLWRWFVEPFGVQPISIAWAAGLSLFAGLLTARAKEKEETSVIFAVCASAIVPAIALGFGYVIAGFMP